MKIVFIYDGLQDKIYEVTIPSQVIIKSPHDRKYYAFTNWSHPDDANDYRTCVKLKDTVSNANPGTLIDLLMLPEHMVLLD
jgi:hypothetical protein